MEPEQREYLYESMLNLKGTLRAANFPVIGAFYKGVATSVKTIELTSRSYLMENAV